MFIAITRIGTSIRRPFSSRRANSGPSESYDSASTTVSTEDEIGLQGWELWRLRTYKVLEDPASSQGAKAMSIFILATITVSIVNFMIASYPWDLCGYEADGTRVCAIQPHPGERLEKKGSIKAIESACIFIFSIEYALRLIVCTAKISRIGFLTDPLNCLDVLAIMPWYIDTIVEAVSSGDDEGGGGGIFGVLRIVRLTRVLRVFKVSKSMQSMIVLVRTLKRSFSAFMILLTSILVTMLLFGSFIVFFERGTFVETRKEYLRGDASPSPFLSIPHCMYWCMTSMTTVGYGDMYPVTNLGQVIAVIAMISGIVVLSVPITVIGSNFDEETREQHRINELRKRVAMLEKLRLQERLGDLVPDTSVAGMKEINCLLEDHRTNVMSDVSMLVAKSEATFSQMVRKVIIHSRVFADGDQPKPNGRAGGESATAAVVPENVS